MSTSDMSDMSAEEACCVEGEFSEWMTEFDAVWNRLAARLARLPADDDEHERAAEDAKTLRQLFRTFDGRYTGVEYSVLWEEAFSGLAEVVHDCKRLAVVAEQGTAALQSAVIESISALQCPVMCLARWPLDYLTTVPAAQRQQHEALSQLFLAAGPKLVSALAVERAKQGRGSAGYMEALVSSLQTNARRLLQPPLSSLLEPSSVRASMERWLYVLELARRKVRLTAWPVCGLFGMAPPAKPLDSTNDNSEPCHVLLRLIASKPRRAVLAFHYYAGGICKLASDLEAAARQSDAAKEPVIWPHMGVHLGANSLACMSDLLLLNSGFSDGLLSEATKADPFLYGQLCAALTKLAIPFEMCIGRSEPMASSSPAANLLSAWSRAWLLTVCGARMATDLWQHSSPLYAEQLLVSTGSMVHVATALGRWQEDGRPSRSSSSSITTLLLQLSDVWMAAKGLAMQAHKCLQHVPEAARPYYKNPEAVLMALQSALGAMTEAAAAWQWCHTSSCIVAREPREKWLPKLCKALATTTALLLSQLLEPELLQPLFRVHGKDAVGTITLALQVQVKAALALELGSWGREGRDMLAQVTDCLILTLKLSSSAFPSLIPEGSIAGLRVAGGGPARVLPVGPYLHIVQAVRTLHRLGSQQLPRGDDLFRKLAGVLCWLLIYQGHTALHAGAGRLLPGCCTALSDVSTILSTLRASNEVSAALGSIHLLGAAAKSLSDSQQERGRDMQLERQLSMHATTLLKQCCVLVDAAAGTSLAAIDAENEAEGAQLMRNLLRTGQPNAADTVRAHLWQRRRERVLPRLAFLVRRGCPVMLCAGQPHCSSIFGGGSSGSSGGSSGSSGGSSQELPQCPRLAVAGELEMIVGRACSSPTCCAVLLSEGSRLLVCRGCKAAHYCSSTCAQADWQRHRPLCSVIRGLERSGGSQLLTT